MGSRQVEINFKFRPSEPLRRPEVDTAPTSALLYNALYVNNKVFFGAYFCFRVITDIQGAQPPRTGPRQDATIFRSRPPEPLPRPDFETATTTDLVNIALYVNNKVFFGAYFCCRVITDIQGA